MNQPKESDWKTYAKQVPKLRERYLEERNRALAAMLTDPEKEATERFWEVRKQYKEEERILDMCLGKYARSDMFFSMLAMLRFGMLEEDELEMFSEELVEALLKARGPME